MKQTMENALTAIASMIDRSEKAQRKFPEGTSQHTLLKNRIQALHIAALLIRQDSEENAAVDFAVSAEYTTEDLEKALAPIASLISKSEKAQQKLAQASWQHTMLEDHLNALYVALPLLEKACWYLQN